MGIIHPGKFGKFEITTVLDANGENKPSKQQINELHAVPNIIVTRRYKQDGVDVFVAKSVAGVIFIKTNDSDLIKLFSDSQKDNVAVNLFQTFNSVEDTPAAVVDTTGLLFEKLDFCTGLSDVHLTKLKASPYANVVDIERHAVFTGTFATNFDLATSVGKYVVIVKDEAIATKLATAFVTGQSVNLFEKIEG